MTAQNNVKQATQGLFIFVIVYPLFLFPGALFLKPETLFDIHSQSVEWFQQLPKVLLLLAAGLLGFLTFKPQNKKDPFLWLLGLHLLLVIVGCLNARDALTFSILGPDRRMDGLLYQTGLVLFSIFVYQTLRLKPDALPTLLLGLLWSGFIQSLVVLLQKVHLDVIGPLISWKSIQAPLGSVGQPGMLAGLLLVSLSAGLLLYIAERNERNRWFLLAGIILVAAATGATTNRSSLIGLAIILAALNIQQRSWKMAILSSLTVLTIFCANTWLIEKASNREYTNTTTGQSRILFWRLAISNLAKIPGEPFIGGGPDAFRLSILRDPQVKQLLPIYALEYGWPANARILNAKITQEDGSPLRSKLLTVTFYKYKGEKDQTIDFPLILDKTHNMLLDRLLDYGGFSLLIWMLLYLLPAWRLIHNKSNFIYPGVGWILVGLFAYYLAWFPVVQVEPLHLLVVAVAWTLLSKELVPPAKSRLDRPPFAYNHE